MTILQKRERIRALRAAGVIPKTYISGLEIVRLRNDQADEILAKFGTEVELSQHVGGGSGSGAGGTENAGAAGTSEDQGEAEAAEAGKVADGSQHSEHSEGAGKGGPEQAAGEGESGSGESGESESGESGEGEANQGDSGEGDSEQASKGEQSEQAGNGKEESEEEGKGESGESEKGETDKEEEKDGSGEGGEPDEGEGEGEEAPDLAKLIADATRPHLLNSPAVEIDLEGALCNAVSKAFGDLSKGKGEDEAKELFETAMAELKKEGGEFAKLREEVEALNSEVASLKQAKQESAGLTEIIVQNEAGKVKAKLNGGGHYHSQLPELYNLLSCRDRNGYPLSAWIWGAAGGGKTTLAHQLSAMLGQGDLAQVVSMGPTYTESKLLGFRSLATGDYIQGEIRNAYENGGLVLLDEADMTDAGVLVAANALLANSSFLFPDGKTVARHPDFYCCAGANTLGFGATDGYKRNALDAATLDRFVPVRLDYDRKLELALAGDLKGWAKYIHEVRSYLEKIGSTSVMGMRAILFGVAQLEGGIAIDTVRDRTLCKLPLDLANAIKAQIQLPEVKTENASN